MHTTEKKNYSLENSDSQPARERSVLLVDISLRECEITHFVIGTEK